MNTNILIEFTNGSTLEFTVRNFLDLKFVGPYLFITDHNGASNSWELERMKSVKIDVVAK